MLVKRPVVDVDDAAVGHTASAVWSASNCGAVTWSVAGDGGGEAEAVAVEGAPLGRAHVIGEAIEVGFTEEELFRHVRREKELPGPEEVQEDAEAIGIPIDEDRRRLT